MSEITRTPKAAVVELTEEQRKKALELKLERDDAYARYRMAAQNLDALYQGAAGGKNRDWELTADEMFLVVFERRP